MLSFAFLVFAVIHVGIWIWTFNAWNRLGRPAALSIVLFCNLLLWYDNFRIGMGRFIGEGDLLYNLSVPAFFWHWTFLPLLVIVAGSIARLADFPWARSKAVMGVFCLTAMGLMLLDLPYAIGLVFGQVGPIAAVELHPGCIADTLRYTTNVPVAQLCSPDGEVITRGPGAAFVAIVMNLIMLVLGVYIWVKTGWKWLALGPGAMFIAAGVGGPLTYGLPIANFGEILFTLGVVSTCIHFARLKQERSGSAAIAGLPAGQSA